MISTELQTLLRQLSEMEAETGEIHPLSGLMGRLATTGAIYEELLHRVLRMKSRQQPVNPDDAEALYAAVMRLKEEMTAMEPLVNALPEGGRKP